MKVLSLFGGGPGNEIVEDMEVPLAVGSTRNPVAFEIVIKGLDAGQPTPLGKLELGIFSEARRVGVEKSAGVSKCFDNEFRSRNLCGEFGTFLAGITHAELEKSLDGKASVLRLSASGFATEYKTC